MAGGIFETGKLVVEIKALNPERVLNILWNENINILKVKKVDVVTIRGTIEYKDYDDLKRIVKRLNGKVKIVGERGILFFFFRLKNKMFLCIGAGVFYLFFYTFQPLFGA